MLRNVSNPSASKSSTIVTRTSTFSYPEHFDPRQMADSEQDYEAIRQENIRKNAELMLSLGLNPVSICATVYALQSRRGAAPDPRLS